MVWFWLLVETLATLATTNHLFACTDTSIDDKDAPDVTSRHFNLESPAFCCHLISVVYITISTSSTQGWSSVTYHQLELKTLPSTHPYPSNFIIKSIISITNTHSKSSRCLHQLVLSCSRSEPSQSAVARVLITFVKDSSSRVCIQIELLTIPTNSI